MPVSVIMPIFNRVEYLPRSISSVLNQTFPFFELVTIDDCSTDETSSFLTQNMIKDPRIKLIQHKYNQGTLSSRNHGVLESKGDYIMSLDPDDSFFNNSIELSYKAIIDYAADVLEFRMVVAFSNKTYRIFNDCYMGYSDDHYALKKLTKIRNSLVNWNVCKKIIKRSVYLKAVKLILPFVKNKKIVNTEDLLQTAGIFLYMRSQICTQILSYIYYRDVIGSITGTGYLSKGQRKAQSRYVSSIVNYLYECRKNVSNCTAENFFKIPRNARNYVRVESVDNKIIKECNINVKGYLPINVKEMGYCVYLKL